MPYKRPYNGNGRPPAKRAATTRGRPFYVPRTTKRTADRNGGNARTGGYTGIEFKFLDTAWNAVAVAQSTDGSGGELQPSTGCTDCLSMPAEGNGESQRIGRKFTLRGAYASGAVTYTALANQADAVDYGPVYVALVLDQQANGATIASENVFVNPGTGTVAMMPQPLRNLQFSKRFRVLDHKTVSPAGIYAMTDGASTGSINVQVQPTFELGWRGELTVLASGTSADVANATDNALHVIAFTGSSASGTPTIQGKCRVRYTG